MLQFFNDFWGDYVKIDHIMNKNLDLLKPFLFNKETLSNDIENFLTINYNRNFPVLDM